MAKKLSIKQLEEIIDAWQPREIIVKCKGSRTVQFHDLADFQGPLKQITEKQLLKLCYGIIKLGFVMPIAIWKNKILDGHQRIKALVLLEDKGFKIPAIPIVDINAATEREAKAMVLAISSQYAQTIKSEFDAWLEEIGEDIEKIISIDNILSEIDIDVDDDQGKDKSVSYDILVSFEDKEKRQEFFDKLQKKGYSCRMVK